MLAVLAAIPGIHKDRTHPRILRSLDIGRGVANEPGLFQVEIQFGGSLNDHAGRRLAAGACDFQVSALAREPFVWMVRAVVDSIKERVLPAQQSLEFIVNLLNVSLGT